MATPAQAAALPRPRPYRRFLTSALHTKFVHAALVSLLISWDNAALLGPKSDLLWWWFPLGPAGVKTLLYFFTNLFIFFLQIATLNVGSSTSTSPLSQLRKHAFSLDTGKTFLAYLVSALFFSEVYIWSAQSLEWVTKGEKTRYDVLNERPIYLRSFYFVLAIVHATRHLYYSHSTIRIPISPSPTANTKDARTHPVDDKYAQMKEHMPRLLIRTVAATLLSSLAAPFIYTILLRQVMWKAHLSLVKPFYNMSRSNARVTGLPPIFGTLHVTFITGCFLGFTWEMCSLLFRTYLCNEPTKKDVPLSAVSKDPNGTLLNGLKAKRDTVKTFAFWELAIIAQKDADRRKAIFTDIERPTGAMWTQMLGEALKVLKQVDDRISPPRPPALTVDTKPQTIATLPKLVQETKAGDIFVPPTSSQSARKAVEGWALEGVKRIGTSPEPWRPPLDKAVLMIEQSGVGEASQTITREVRQSPLAWFFVTSNGARINATVLGSPQGNAAVLVDAIEVVTRMMISSLQEDLYGNTIKGVPAAVKQFTTSITLIETFIKANSPSPGSITEVEIVLGRLKAGLRELLAAFQTFLSEQALGIGELNAAKNASVQKVVQGPKGKETLQFRDVELPPLEDDRPDDARRPWGEQRSDKEVPQRLQSSQAPSGSLFIRQEPPRRKTSRETNGRTVHAPRRREMEQVR